MSQNKANTTRYGIFYRSRGKWIGPYGGKTYSAYSVNRNPVLSEIQTLKNYVLKTKVRVAPVG